MSHPLQTAVDAGLVLVYLLAIGAILYGSAVPTYQAAASERVADTVLTDSVRTITDVVSTRPAPATEQVAGRTRLDIDLPETIDGQPYRVVSDGRTLRLEHPDPALGSAVVLPFDRKLTRIEGSWTSTEPAGIELQTNGDNGYVVNLITGPGDGTCDGDQT